MQDDLEGSGPGAAAGGADAASAVASDTAAEEGGFGAREMITMLSGAGCKLYACELAMKMFGLTEDDLLPEVDAVLTAGDFYEVTPGAQIVFV